MKEGTRICKGLSPSSAPFPSPPSPMSPCKGPRGSPIDTPCAREREDVQPLAHVGENLDALPGRHGDLVRGLARERVLNGTPPEVVCWEID